MSHTADSSGAAGNPVIRALRAYYAAPSLLDRIRNDAALWGASAGLLGLRLFLALPFWNAGQARLNSWGSQSFLFEYEHPLPLLSPTQAAYLTTGAELVLPVLLILGLFGRLAGLGLAIMAATIFFVIGGAYAIAAEQMPWMLAGLVIFLAGSGRLSVDHLVARFVR